MKIFFPLLIVSCILVSCNSDYPGIPKEYHVLLDTAMARAEANSVELHRALSDIPTEQKEGMAFIISYMPLRDLKGLTADFLIENSKYAYWAKEKYSWCSELPDSIFFNEVLPYANITEERDPWRKDFFERFTQYVEDKENMVDAIFAIARTINEEVEVEYNTNRSKVDLSPKEAMEEHMATCTGLSIILTDAFRSVGIPSRLAGTAMWTNYRGNHTWSEVFVDNEWQFIEYYPDTLNKSWFVADAGKADPDNPMHWIYAVSYKPTDQYYYAGVATQDLISKIDINKFPPNLRNRYSRMKTITPKERPYVWGVNVTERYIDLYRESIEGKELQDNELVANFTVYKSVESTEDLRLSCRVEVYESDKLIDFGYSPRETDDMNQFLKFRLQKSTEYYIKITNPEFNISNNYKISTGNDDSEDHKLVLK